MLAQLKTISAKYPPVRSQWIKLDNEKLRKLFLEKLILQNTNFIYNK
jgi:hypothetical protein